MNNNQVYNWPSVKPLVDALSSFATRDIGLGNIAGHDMQEEAISALRAAGIPLVEEKPAPSKWRRIPGSPLEWAVEVSEREMPYREAGRIAAEMGGRLPTLPELQMLIDYGCKDNAERLGIPKGWYWTATKYAPDTDGAWVVTMYDGHLNSSPKTYYACFWACRGGQSETVTTTASTGEGPNTVRMPPLEGPIKEHVPLVRCGPSDTDRILEALALMTEARLFGEVANAENIKAIRALKGGA